MHTKHRLPQTTLTVFFLKKFVISWKSLKEEFVVNILHVTLYVSVHPFQRDVKGNAKVWTDIAGVFGEADKSVH